MSKIKVEHDGLVIEAADTALLRITSDRLPGCRFWYDEGLTNRELIQLVDARFGEDSKEAADALNAPFVITYDDGNVEYVLDAYTSTTTGALIGYTIGRYAAVHGMPHECVLHLLSQMHQRLECERHSLRY